MKLIVVFTVIAVLAVALVAIYLVYQDGDQPPATDAQQVGIEEAPMWQQRQAAEKLAEEWITALNNKDIEALVSLCHVPFYFGRKLLFSPEEIWDEFQRYFATSVWLRTEVRSKTARTIAELREGDDVLRDLVLGYFGLNDERIRGQEKIYEKMKGMWLNRARNELQLSDRDFAIIVTANAEGSGSELVSVFVRRHDADLKIAGTEK